MSPKVLCLAIAVSALTSSAALAATGTPERVRGVIASATENSVTVDPVGPGYQTAFAERIRHAAQIATAAIGMITAAAQADHIIRTGQADLVLLACELLREPYWPLHAAKELGVTMPWPAQYLRAAPRGTPEGVPTHEID
jgi:2,4-dienoyl-CoA reductase-like NADH-dependent reductase (Old Yellow Enzyme family)